MTLKLYFLPQEQFDSYNWKENVANCDIYDKIFRPYGSTNLKTPQTASAKHVVYRSQGPVCHPKYERSRSSVVEMSDILQVLNFRIFNQSKQL